MKITIESTEQLIDLAGPHDLGIKARLWEGHTDSGIPVQCLIVRIGVPANANTEQFDRELKEQITPTVPSMFPLKMVI